jgi:hypothetical protein
MATATTTPTMMAVTRNNRGKDQIHWSEGVWNALDCAIMEEMMRTRVAAKFLPQVHVDRTERTVASDVVIVPLVTAGVPFDSSLSIEESATLRIHEYSTRIRLSVAQAEAEEYEEMAMNHAMPASPTQETVMMAPHRKPALMSQYADNMSHPQRASTAVSLVLRAANILAQAEDIVNFTGGLGVVYSPLFQGGVVPGVGNTGPLVHALDPNLATDLDLGLLNIQPLPPGPGLPAGANVITLPPGQVIPVHPVPPPPGTPTFPPMYRENGLNAIVQAVSALQGLLHYENYACVLHTYPYADLHQALPTTLIEPVEPVSHIVKAGIYGTGTLPPFTPVTQPGPQPLHSGLPTHIQTSQGPVPLSDPPLNIAGSVLYMATLVSLSGNTMDIVRGQMDDNADVILVFNQKDLDEQHRFRVVQRFAFRLKDPTAVILLLFMDS